MRNDWVSTLLLSLTRAAFAGAHNSAAVALNIVLMLAAAAAACATSEETICSYGAMCVAHVSHLDWVARCNELV